MSKIIYHREGDIYIPDAYIKNNRKVNLGKYGLMRWVRINECNTK